MPTERLIRTQSTYEFIVSYPWGISAVTGYRKAARHFGWKTLTDPTTDGTDTWRLLVHREAGTLRRTTKMLGDNAVNSDERDDNDGLSDEFEILINSGVSWFDHDWKYWDVEQDDGTLENLGWTRTVVQRNNGSYRVTIRLTRKAQKQPRRPIP